MTSWKSLGDSAALLPSEGQAKRMRNIAYLMKLKEDNLLFPYWWQAGLTGSINAKLEGLHGGWDSQTSHIRGTFTAHWISAAAYTIREQEDRRLRAKLEYVVAEIRRCQVESGGGWCFPIPPSYITGVRSGRYFWAPLYVCHKVLMGMLDAWRMAGIEDAAAVIRDAAGWFETFAAETSREQLSDMMDRQETGGLMELWADLYGYTGEGRYARLMRLYERPRLFEPLIRGEDILTNMHANTTIPEIHGAARAYEVTGEECYRKIVEEYWRLAVTDRGQFATGGQTSGEVWTPKNRQANRLGDQTQEHCVVYNMIRLADYLFRWTGEREYADYIERNIWNGLFAQGHWESRALDQCAEPYEADRGLIAYYLPLQAGAHKNWGSETEHCWCCHCTLMQAHSRLREWVFYQQEDRLRIAQYQPCRAALRVGGVDVTVEQTETDLGGSCNQVNETALKGEERPMCWSFDYTVTADQPVELTLEFRLPWWLAEEPVCWKNGKEVSLTSADGWASLRVAAGDQIRLRLPKKLHCWPLPDEPDTVAFLDGPVVLAGLVGEERMLFGNPEHPEEFLKPANERVWSLWTQSYRTFNQPSGFYFKPLYQIGKETYTVYFPVRSYPVFQWNDKHISPHKE